MSCGGAVPGARPTRIAPRFVDAAAPRFVDAAAPRFVDAAAPTILKYILKNWCELVAHKCLLILKNTEKMVQVQVIIGNTANDNFKV